MNKNELVCNCINVTVQDLEDAIKNGAKSFEEVQEATQVGNGCGRCKEHAREVVSQLLGK